MALLPADEDGFDEAVRAADAVADDDALVLGVADPVAEGDEAAVRVGAALVQLEFGVGLLVPSDVGLGVTVGVGLPLGVWLGLAVPLGLVVLALGEALAPVLAVLPPLWLPLDDVADAVALLVGLLAEPLVVGVSDGCADGDGQALSVL